MCSGAAGRTCTASARITRLLAIEDALESAEMRAGVLRRVGEDQAVSLAHHLGPHGLQLRAHRARQQLQPAGTLEVVKGIEGFGDRWPDDDHAVVGEEQDALRAQHAGEAVAFGIVEHQPVIRVVVGDVVVKAQRVLLDHLQPAVLDEGQRGGVRHMRMKDARRPGTREMNPRVDVEGGLLELALAFQDVAVGIEREKAGGRDLAPVQPVAVEKKALPIRQHQAEVVADPLVQVHAHGDAECRREVDARRALDRPRGPQLLHRSHGVDYIAGMNLPTLALDALLLLAACSKVTQENFAKIQEGMSEQQVIALLGAPTESNSVNVLGVSGTASRWVSRDAVITVRFVNGKVALRSFDKPPPDPKAERK